MDEGRKQERHLIFVPVALLRESRKSCAVDYASTFFLKSRWRPHYARARPAVALHLLLVSLLQLQHLKIAIFRVGDLQIARAFSCQISNVQHARVLDVFLASAG